MRELKLRKPQRQSERHRLDFRKPVSIKDSESAKCQHERVLKQSIVHAPTHQRLRLGKPRNQTE